MAFDFEAGSCRCSVNGGAWMGGGYGFSVTLTTDLEAGDYERLMHGTPEPCSIQDAIALRDEAGLPRHISAKGVAWVVDRVGGDVGLALDALTMIPRPSWVVELLGLHP